MSDIICKNCQSAVTDKAKFCIKCGALCQEDAVCDINITEDSTGVHNGADAEDYNNNNAINTVVNTDTPKKKNKMFPPIITAVAVIVAVVTAFILFMPDGGMLFGKSASFRYPLQKNNISVIPAYNWDNAIIFPINSDRIEIEGSPEKYSLSMDGSKAVVLVDEDPEGVYSNHDSGYALYQITDKKKLISDDVYDFALASSGNAVLYVKEFDSSEETYELWLYSDTDEKPLKIADDCSIDFYWDIPFNISADGKTVVYSALEKDRLTGFIWDGQKHELGRDILPFAVSDGAKYIYYYNYKNDSLYVQKGISDDNREKLTDDFYQPLYANNDLSQIIYESNNKSYICINGEEKIQLSGKVDSFIFPEVMEGIYSNYKFATFGVSGFEDTYYRSTDGALIKINNSYETTSIAKNADYAYLSDNGNILTYLRNERVFKVNTNDDSAEPEPISDGNIDFFISSSDGEAIYFINNDGEIYYQINDEKPVVVAYEYDDLCYYYNGLDYFNNFATSLFNGNTLLYISDGELYVSDGGKGKLIGSINGEVDSATVSRFHIFALATDYGDRLIYNSNDAKEFKLIHEEEISYSYGGAATTTAPNNR